MKELITNGKERILIISPHADDEVLGCGGLIEKGCRYDNHVKVVVMAVGNIKHKHTEGTVSGTVRKSELKEAMVYLGCKDFKVVYDDKDSLLDTIPRSEIISKLDCMISHFSPTMVFIPLPSYHQDHIIIYESCIAALRPKRNSTIKLIAMYEYPLSSWYYQKFWNIGELYLDISNTIDKKIEAFRKHKSQIRVREHPISPEGIRILAQNRGLEAGMDFAEKYYILRSTHL